MRTSLAPADRRHVDNLAAVLLLEKRRDGPVAKEYALEIDVERQVPILLGDALQRYRLIGIVLPVGHTADTMRTGEDIHRSHPVDRLLHQFLDLLQIADIRLQCERLASLLFHLFGNLLGKIHIYITHYNICPLLCKTEGNAFAQSTASTGHDGNLIF